LIAFLSAVDAFAMNRVHTRKRRRESDSQAEGNGVERAATMEHLSIILGWYRVLRSQRHWTIFQSIRYALWLAR
jgi:hypothetical protein